MPEIILKNSNNRSEIITSSEKKPRPASWFAEVVIISQLWIRTELLTKMIEKVRVERGRMGIYEVIDFMLVILGYSISQEKSMSCFFNEIKPFKTALAGLWEREKSPSQSALSRFLEDVKEENVEEVRKLLFEDLLNYGIKKEHIGGVYDKSNTQHLCFDLDITKDAARQRSVAKGDDYPQAKRRRKNYGKGYAGRKRGEVVRSRTTLQQSHTSEWLGSFGSVGNPEHFNDLEKCCKLVAQYMKQHSLESQSSIIRMDGQYGWARAAYVCKENNVGYLMRCSDYRLIEKVEVKELLERSEVETFYQIDTQTQRKVIDCGFIEWQASGEKNFSSLARLIVAKSDAPKDLTKVKVGKIKGNYVYELFITDRRSEQFSAKTLLSLYFARGGFEQSLSQEDFENDPDRFYSQHHFGQEFCQLISIWLWNARLRLGFIATDSLIRHTLWTTSTTQESSSQTQTQTQTQVLKQEVKESLQQDCQLNKNQEQVQTQNTAIYWDDLEACRLRRFLPNLLKTQDIEITFPALVLNSKPTIISRDQRAHRRLSWSLRFKRNSSLSYSSPWHFFIFGLPSKISCYLSNINSLAA